MNALLLDCIRLELNVLASSNKLVVCVNDVPAVSDDVDVM